MTILETPTAENDGNVVGGRARIWHMNWSHEMKEFVADCIRLKEPNREMDIELERHLGLLDLVLLGVGGTLGSGLFLLAGRAARDVAGPAVSLSFVLAAIACVFSGFSYAEMASRMPACGGAYSFVYSTIGEFVAFLVGMCLTLEYGVSSAAVARAWAAYVGEALLWLPSWVTGRGSGFCVLGFALMVTISSLIAIGIRETKWVINTATALYAVVVGIVIIVGAPRVDLNNWSPFIPFGLKSVVTGASAVFFSYIGFDEISCVAEEAKNPSKNVPTAILSALAIVALLYVGATLTLTGMVFYKNIDFEAPFPAAFRSVGLPLLARITSIGVAIGMCNTALVGILSQTRLFLALSQDGLIPRSLGENARRSTVACGFMVSLLALRVPTQALTDVVSGGTLLAFLGANLSLILTRYRALPNGPRYSSSILYVFVAGCFIFGFAVRLHTSTLLKTLMYALSCPMLVISFLIMNSEKLDIGTHGELSSPSFRCPWVPIIPLLGALTTSMLFTQLSHKALIALAAWLFMSAAIYCTHGRYNSYANHVHPIPTERTAVSANAHPNAIHI